MSPVRYQKVSALVVIGSQWGDEGKGKFVDVMASRSDGVVRFQGGANAGHTLIVGDKKIILHLIPSGILHDHVCCLIGNGVSLDPFEILREIQDLKAQGYLSDDKQLCLSDGALLVLPFHHQLDRIRELKTGTAKIGTTGRGIGPSYEDRASRRALLFRDLFCPDLKTRLARCLEEKNFLLEKFYGQKPVDIEAIHEKLLKVSEALKVYRCDHISLKVTEMIQAGKRILFEGAQGVLLDNYHGSYPFVTSSQTLAASAFGSVGVNPKFLTKVVGITKAYCTRVGHGPFPTEQKNQVGERLQNKGHEFGATTGRKRRCGWLDLVALRYAVCVGGMDELILTKLDVLSHFDKIRVCTHYEWRGEKVDCFSFVNPELDKVKPVYVELEGWKTDISGCRNFEDLPEKARQYIAFIENQVNLEIPVISVGPDRMETIYRRDIFIHPCYSGVSAASHKTS